MQDFRLVALAPPGMFDPSIAIAASRAGALGVLDLTLAGNAVAARRAVDHMAAHTRGACGLRIDAQSAAVRPLASRLPANSKTIILAGDWADAAELVRDLKRDGCEVLLEVTSIPDSGEPLDAADGLVAKGNESGGEVGEETTFILLQRLLAETTRPVLAHGGIGLRTAAAVRAAGAAGAVLDSQLLLTRESPLPEQVRRVIGRMDGSETACLGAGLGTLVRGYAAPTATAQVDLRRLAERLREHDDRDVASSRWRRAARSRLGWEALDRRVWPLGQDAAFARPLAERHVTTGRVIIAVSLAADAGARAARRRSCLAEGAPLAQAHGTRFPIVQGPMTRVSDSPAFAAAVAEGGGLPFLSLALSRGSEVAALLRDTRERLGGRPWGAGILGFVPRTLREEQLAAIRACPPPFALIAGGRPDQAHALEEVGISTYLHVSSPALLELFVAAGARRFVFEGRECGGHVGPRSSFVLWESMVATLLGTLDAAKLQEARVLFAGGVHDGLSAAMVAAIAEPLAEHGARIGVLLGTAYLFTREAVETGAVVSGFQREALQCVRTALLESGPGHVTRCAFSGFVETFEAQRRALRKQGCSGEELRAALEELNLGRLRIASKGLRRTAATDQGPGDSRIVEVSAGEQRADGMYMMGQVAALRRETCSIVQLHRDVAEGRASMLTPTRQGSAIDRRPRPFDAAIIGMSCLLPQAPDAHTFWENILAGVDAITEVPTDRWSLERYFDPDPAAPDKIYSRWGGFLDDVVFDPLRYGMPPASLVSIEPLQLLALEAARAALADAGYLDRPFARERTAVIFGAGGGVADLGHRYAVRAGLPMVLDELPDNALAKLPEWTEDSFPGILLNVVAGRIANRFDLGGVNYTVDAACASSLAAVQLAARELESGASDMVLVGGGDTAQNAFGYTCFSKTHALSPTGRCRTFDSGADGIAISEGIAVIVLKRLADAERDGDRVYAVLKAVAGSSDGRDRGLTAPRPEGQALALRRAYAQAGFSPATVGLVEAHGTGTVAGDLAEITTLRAVFEEANAPLRRCALGSVKSMIGHTKCAAGLAGLIKAAHALHGKVLPPTLHVERPNPAAGFEKSPFYLNGEVRPWIHAGAERPRRAGVSAFGFGGTNFHAVLEEYTGGFLPSDAQGPGRAWPAELFLWSAASARDLLQAIEPVERALADGAAPQLRDLSRTVWERRAPGERALAIVASSIDDLRNKLTTARASLARGDAEVSDPTGIFFTDAPLAGDGKLAFLFPGQGSQGCGMLRELAVHFQEVREAFSRADAALIDRFFSPLSTFTFPPTAFGVEERRAQEAALRATEVAQPALAAAAVGAINLLGALGITPDLTAGHSYGEYVALHAAGALSEQDLYVLSHDRGRAIVDAARGEELGTMAAVAAGASAVQDALDGTEVEIANLNGPHQTVISGTPAAVAAAVDRLRSAGLHARELPVACAFHSLLVAPARDRLGRSLDAARFRRPRLEVYSNVTAGPYPAQSGAIRALLAEHLVKPVRFHQEIDAMYEAGARIYIEAGPRAVLTGLVGQILAGRQHLAVPIDDPAHQGLVGLLHAIARLAVHGVTVELDRLHAGRDASSLDLAAVATQAGVTDPPASAWLVNGGRSRPLRAQSVPQPTPKAPAVHPAAPQPTRRAVAVNGSHSDAMRRHADVMRRFVDTQEAVMLAHLTCRKPPPLPVPAEAPAGVEDGLPRFTLQAVERPLPHLHTPLLEGPIVITDDGRGIATELATRLGRKGDVPVVVDREQTVELADVARAQALLDPIRQRHGGIAALVYLGALWPEERFEDLSLDAWQSRLAADIEPLLLLARAAAVDLARPRARLLAVTALGNTFGVDRVDSSFDPRHGALAGFAKSAAAEWSEAVVRVVDIDLDDPPVRSAEHLADELLADDGEREIAWSAARRTAPLARPAPLRSATENAPVDRGSVVLVTGGARGITAEIALELAERYGPHLILAGRTALPTGSESAATAAMASRHELRAALLAQRASNGRPTVPAEIEAECSRLLGAREIRRNLQTMQAAGAVVEYRQVDVADGTVLRQLLDDIYSEHGRIDGVIHGAGIIEDSLIANKDVASLRRVLATKALAAVALSRALRTDHLAFLVLFGSVAGRFGNRGQADYAAANQILSKLAAYLDARWRARVVALDWGPWSQIGMAAAETGRRLEEHGMRSVSPSEGRRAFAEELSLGRKGEAEVILGAGPWTLGGVGGSRSGEVLVS